MKDVITRLWKPELKIDYHCIRKNRPIWEPCEFEKIKNPDTLISFHQPKKSILENRSGSHNIM